MTGLSKSGFSLVEVLIALVLLTVGVLALARSMAAMNHMSAAGGVLTKVALVGTNQMERLIAGGCELPVPAAASNGGIGYSWSAGTTGNSISIDVILRYPLDYSDRVDSLGYIRVCPNVP